jgi:hypothetical protein
MGHIGRKGHIGPIRLLWACALLAAFGGAARGHDGLELDPPRSAADAWNMLNLCRANLRSLALSGQWSEMPIQASLSIQALRYLRESSGGDTTPLAQAFFQLEDQARFLYQTAESLDDQRTPRELRAYEKQLQVASEKYPEAVRNATIYGCSMCRGIREGNPATPCFKCGMALVPRIIPASTLYDVPGEPSVRVTPLFERPLAPGEPAAGKVRLTRKKDGQPVTPADLLVVHTERIHLLIVDESLRDYHHEHPRPTEIPGEYAFSFTPVRPGSYRIFADIVPGLSNVQEYADADLPGAAPGDPVQPAPNSTLAELEGLRFQLAWETGGLRLKARQPARATVTVTDAAGQPFTQLEPIMGTFAHLVAFHQDRRTVLHIHPTDAVPQQPEDRGGPSFKFQFYAPQAGYYRLYAQVQIGGKSRFAPFDLNVE